MLSATWQWAKGFENAANYTGVKLLFMDIENIHVIRNSLNQIHAICYGSKTGKDSLQYESTWLSAIDATKWFKHLGLILSASDKLARMVSQEENFLPCPLL